MTIIHFLSCWLHDMEIYVRVISVPIGRVIGRVRVSQRARQTDIARGRSPRESVKVSA